MQATCAEVLAALSAIEGGGSVAPALLADLVDQGWAQRVARPSTGDDARLRAALVAARTEREALRGRLASLEGADRAAAKAQIGVIEAEERVTRAAILELAALPASSELVAALSFRGRDLRGELESRVERCGATPVTTFVAEFDALRAALARTAQLAATLLADWSPRVELEEHDLRAIAVGLATIDRDGVSERFREVAAAVSALPPAHGALAAEAMTASPSPLGPSLAAMDFGALTRALRPSCDSDDDAVHAASVAWDGDRRVRDEQVRRGLAFAATWTAGPRAPAFLLVDAAASDEAASNVPGLERLILQVDSDRVAARWAAAFLALSPGSFERWREVRGWLTQWGVDGVTAAAAMLVLIEGPAAELLDDLRLASSAVRDAKLSLHAVESLALGVKLLLGVAQRGDLRGTSAALDALGAPARFAALPVAKLPPRFAQAFVTFHAVTVHRQVRMRARHHRLHSHRVYG